MLTACCLASTAFFAPCGAAAPHPSLPVRLVPPELPGPQDEDEFDRRRTAARGDVEALWKVADWCEARGELRERDLVLRDILKLDDSDRKAHELLGHIEFEGEWFESERKLEAHRKKLAREADKAAKAKGLVRYEDRWVEPADLPFLERGLVRDAEGRWISAEEQARIDAGWRRQDLDWIPPEEVPFLEKDLWKCGDDWLTLDEANLYHAAVSQEWRIPGENFVLWGTPTREVSIKALTEADFAFADLKRLFGVSPAEPPVLLVLESQDQYGTFSKGRNNSDVGKSAFGFSSLHGAYFADNWFRDGAFVGAGVTYWDVNDDTANRFGPLWVRHAAGQSYVDAIDPSPIAAADAVERGIRGFEFATAFWQEKVLPLWLRYGAATYVERYAPDRAVGPEGDPYWARKWSIENIENRDGIDSVEEILAFALNPDDPEKSGKLINESGLLVAFVLDGDCKPVEKEHARLLEAMSELTRDRKQGQREVEKAIERLQKALVKNEKKLAAFAAPDESK